MKSILGSSAMSNVQAKRKIRRRDVTVIVLNSIILNWGIFALCTVSVASASGPNSESDPTFSAIDTRKDGDASQFVVRLIAKFSPASHELKDAGNNRVSQLISSFKDGMMHRLAKLGIKSEDVGDLFRAYALDENFRQSIFIIDLKSSNFKLPNDKGEKTDRLYTLKPLMVKNGKLILGEGMPTQKQVDAILASVESEEKIQGIFNVKIAWHKIIEKSNLSLDEFVNKILNRQFGITREEAQLPFLIEKLAGAEFAAQLLFYLKNVEFALEVDEKNMNFHLKMEPVPESPFAKFVQQHQNRELGHLGFFPDNSDIAIFSSIDPEALVKIQQRSLEYDLSDVPWSKLEENYIRETWQLINSKAGDFTSIALYRHPDYGITASIFLESLKSQQVLWKWLSVIRLYWARDLAMEEAGIRSLGLKSTYYANPYNLTQMIETSLELPYGSVHEENASLKGKQVFHLTFGSEAGKTASLSSASVPEGVLAVASENSLEPLAEFVQGFRYGKSKSLLQDPLLLRKKPLFGMLVNLKGISELFNETTAGNPYKSLDTNNFYSMDWSHDDFISVVSWSEQGHLFGRLQMPLKVLDIPKKTDETRRYNWYR
jgi:hypothetical protein